MQHLSSHSLCEHLSCSWSVLNSIYHWPLWCLVVSSASPSSISSNLYYKSKRTNFTFFLVLFITLSNTACPPFNSWLETQHIWDWTVDYLLCIAQWINKRGGLHTIIIAVISPHGSLIGDLFLFIFVTWSLKRNTYQKLKYHFHGDMCRCTCKFEIPDGLVSPTLIV